MNQIIKNFLLVFLIVCSSAKLYQVTSLFRHGARYHINPWYDGNSTFDVWGQLTPVGMRQHQNLGKTLNKQYIQNLKFLNQKYDKNQIEVYSTGYNRTIQSALSQLYGIYPPGNGPRLQYVQRKYHLPPFTNQTDIEQQNFAFPLGHQHIMIKYDTNLLLENCPNYNQLIDKNVALHQVEIQQMNTTYYPFMKKVKQVFNITTDFTFQNLSSLCDTLTVDRYLGRSLPSGFTEDDYNNLLHLFNWYNNIKFSGIVSKLIGSAKYAKILSQFDNRIKNLTGYPRKWTFLSAHDSDVIPATNDLNISSSRCIQELYRKGKTDALNCQTGCGYASSLIFQLHSDNDKDFYVMIRSNGKYMNLCEKQQTKCSYTEWKNRIKGYIISNVDQLCGLKDNQQKGQILRGMQASEQKVI